MAYDFTNAIIISDGSKNISKITKSGTIIWQRPAYIWKKYSANSQETVTTEEKWSDSVTESFGATDMIEVCTDYVLDGDQPYSSGTVDDMYAEQYCKTSSTYPQTYPYYIYSSKGKVGKVYNTRMKFSMTDGTIYFIDYYETVEMVEVTNITYSRGSTFYGYVTSTSSSTYPNDGHKDGYWYVKV